VSHLREIHSCLNHHAILFHTGHWVSMFEVGSNEIICSFNGCSGLVEDVVAKWGCGGSVGDVLA
jgi:hypothetical protein